MTDEPALIAESLDHLRRAGETCGETTLLCSGRVLSQEFIEFLKAESEVAVQPRN
jgi:hypothetical protein